MCTVVHILTVFVFEDGDFILFGVNASSCANNNNIKKGYNSIIFDGKTFKPKGGLGISSSSSYYNLKDNEFVLCQGYSSFIVYQFNSDRTSQKIIQNLNSGDFGTGRYLIQISNGDLCLLKMHTGYNGLYVYRKNPEVNEKFEPYGNTFLYQLEDINDIVDLNEKEEYKNYSYHPKISKTYSNNFGNKGKKNKNMEDIYTKNKEWKKRLEKENNTKKKKYDEIENKKYTFKPEINKLNMENDVPFIMKNIQQMNDYVNKRRKILKKQKEEENYKKRKLGLDANNYNVKTTIPKKFELKTEQRCKSNKKERDINLLNKNIKKKDEFYNNALIMANKNVKIKNNKGFSVLNMGDMEECKNNYWNDNNYNYSNNKGTKIGTSMTQSQQDFLNAVNDLHITIEKLNI